MKLGKFRKDKIYSGNALELCRELPDKSISAAITSPPYYKLRDYGTKDVFFGDSYCGQLGQERYPESYIDHLVEIFDELRRVLEDDGVFWLNIGDTYSGEDIPESGIKKKDLMGIPWRVALAMQKAGWWLRSACVWHRPNQMPESVTDRPVIDYETVFLFSKAYNYFYDIDGMRDPYTKPLDRWGGESLIPKGHCAWDEGTGQTTYRERKMRPNEKGRLGRAVWSINTRPNEYSNFASFPEELAEKCMGAVKKDGIVLDPFMGTGTVAVISKKTERNFLGFELNSDFIKLANKRLKTMLVNNSIGDEDIKKESEEKPNQKFFDLD